MRLSDNMREKIVDEFRSISSKMKEESDPSRKLFFFSGLYGIVFRVFNFEYVSELSFLHLMLQTTYASLKNRINMLRAGDTTVLLPDNYFDILTNIIDEITTRIEKDEPCYDMYEYLSRMIYLTTGNGYYMYLKGIKILPEL